jgi:LysM repeat protein
MRHNGKVSRWAANLIWLGLLMMGLAACGRAPADLGGVDLRDPEVGGGMGVPDDGETLSLPGLHEDTSPRLNPSEPSVTLPPTLIPSPTLSPVATATPASQPESPAEVTAESLPAESPDAPASAETPVAGDDERIHVVAAGENLYRIGLQYGLSWVVIAEYNGLSDPDQISVGQELRIPPSDEPADATTPESANPSDVVADGTALEPEEDRAAAKSDAPIVFTSPSSVAVHVVGPGETLYGVSARYGANWAQVAEANGLATPNQIYAGRILKIPANIPGPAPVFGHQVHAGETLARIAGQYGVALTDLANANGLVAPYVIYRGQLLVIPGTDE